MYIDHKGLSISEIEVEANLYFKIVQQEPITYIERRIIIQEEADPQILERLLQIAENCPISKILKGKVNVLTEFKG
jgi:putative redox protein